LDAIHRFEHGRDLVASKNDRQALGPLGADDVLEPRELPIEHAAVQKQQRGERLVLRRRAHPAFCREGAQEALDVRFSELGGVTLLVKEDEATNPVDAGLFGASAVVTPAKNASHAIQQPRRTGGRNAVGVAVCGTVEWNDREVSARVAWACWH